MDNLERAEIADAARKLWQSFTNDERSMVRYGMFPAEKIRKAEQDLVHVKDRTRLLAVALMDCAKADGGMRA